MWRSDATPRGGSRPEETVGSFGSEEPFGIVLNMH